MTETTEGITTIVIVTLIVARGPITEMINAILRATINAKFSGITEDRDGTAGAHHQFRTNPNLAGKKRRL